MALARTFRSKKRLTTASIAFIWTRKWGLSAATTSPSGFPVLIAKERSDRRRSPFGKRRSVTGIPMSDVADSRRSFVSSVSRIEKLGR